MYALKYGTGVITGWETAAIFIPGEHIPTVSRLCGRYRWLPPIILGGLAIHLYWRELGGKPVDNAKW
jgi:hypothetical protein